MSYFKPAEPVLKLSKQTNMGCSAPTTTPTAITPRNTSNWYLSSYKKQTMLPKKNPNPPLPPNKHKNPQPPLGFKNCKAGFAIPSNKKRERKKKKGEPSASQSDLHDVPTAWETNCPSVAHKGSFHKRLMRGSGVRKESQSPPMAAHLAVPPSHHGFSKCLFWQTSHLNQPR